MNKIIQNFMNNHAIEYDLQNYSESMLFEHFMNRCIINKYSVERFDPNDIMTQNGEIGIDGIAILINGILVNEISDIENILIHETEPSVKFVFIQSKTSEHFDSGEIGTFFYGVKNFFDDKESRIKINDDIERLIHIKDEIYKQSVKLKQLPSIDLYYVCSGRWNNEKALVNRIDQEKKLLDNFNFFSDINVYVYDTDKIINAYKELKKKITKKIEMEKKISFPSMKNIGQAYLGLIKCKDFVNLLKDDEGNLYANIFEDNVRDFQGYNPVNTEIRETVQSNEQQSFSILNNGVTIISKKITLVGDFIELSDYQIVNGCQTSYVLFDNKDKLNDSSCIIVKVVEISDDGLLDRVIYTTNRQTEVKPEAFTSTKKFHKHLQDFYDTIPSAQRLYYERRSKQYDLKDDVLKNKIVTLSMQIASYVAVILMEPHSTHRYYGEILNAYRDKMFKDTDGYEVYYLSAYLNYLIDLSFKNLEIPKHLKIFKYHIMMGFRILLYNSKPCFGKRKEQQKLYETVYPVLLDKLKYKKTLEIIVSCLFATLEKNKQEEADRRAAFTEAFIVNINNLKFAEQSTEFLKKGDVVHCVVQSVNNSFVNVKLKTEDTRNYGNIHVSKFSNRYIPNLRNEISPGQMIIAEIIKDYFDKNNGWSLAKKS